MQKYILTDETPVISQEAYFKAIKMDPNEDGELTGEALKLLEAALQIARPKALCVFTDVKNDSGAAVVEGFKIAEPFVADRLLDSADVAMYVATCGTELEVWSEKITDPLQGFWADKLKILSLGLALGKLKAFVHGEVFAGYSKFIGAVNPGSLPLWPISEQQGLFAALGGVTPDIGVVLTDKFLMLPTKSTSGIYFKSTTNYENCQYCERLTCPNRRAKYAGMM